MYAQRHKKPIIPSVHLPTLDQIKMMLTVINQSQLDSELPNAPIATSTNDILLYEAAFNWFRLREIQIIYDDKIELWRLRKLGEE